eukprot:gene9216-biopygen6192
MARASRGLWATIWHEWRGRGAGMARAWRRHFLFPQGPAASRAGARRSVDGLAHLPWLCLPFIRGDQLCCSQDFGRLDGSTNTGIWGGGGNQRS